MPGYDVEAVRAHFPALKSPALKSPALKQGTAFFDGPGGSQVPDSVAEAVAATLTAAISNRGRVTASERTADEVVLAARAAMADLLSVEPQGVVFGRSMTALTYDMARTLSAGWGPGDEVVVTRLDHDANIRPWVQAATAAGATVRWAEFDPSSAQLEVEQVDAVLTERTQLVAVTGASNLLGSRPDLGAISARVHAAGALLYVDGVHLTPHAPVDVSALGADFYACSPYKFLGPHCGVLAADPDLLQQLHPDKLLPATDTVPERFEFGTLPYELLAGTTAAVDFLAQLTETSGLPRPAALVASMTALEDYEDRLRVRLEEELSALPGVVHHSRAGSRTPTLLLSFEAGSSRGAYEHLATLGVNAPAGSFYAIEASRWLGLADTGGLRVGLAPYTNDDDVDRLVSGLRSFTALG